VDDARALLVLPTRGQADEPVHERAARVARRRMDDDAGRLVDHEDVVVLPGDLERHLLALQYGGRAFGNRQLQLLAALEPVRLCPPLPVHDSGALLQQPLRSGARADLGQRGEETIEPLARSPGGDNDFQGVACDAASGGAGFARAFV
jgi:hypothetical protein